MSNLLLINIVEPIEYDKYRLLSNKLVKCALNNDLGVIFNPFMFDIDLTKQMKQYFIISDDFIQINSENIDTWRIKYDNINDFAIKLKNNLAYINEFIEILFNFTNQTDIYISNDNVSCENDFEEIRISKENVVNYIVDRTLKEYGLSILSMKLCLSKT